MGLFICFVTREDSRGRFSRAIGVLFVGNVYCNIHPFGLPEQKWLDDFVGFGIKTVTKTPF